MKVNIINQTSYPEITVIYDNKRSELKKNESISLNTTCNDFNFDILIKQKNMVLFNFLFALIDGFVDEESVVSSLICNATCNINLKNDETTITINDLEARDDKHGYIYESVYIKSDKADLIDVQYNLSDVKKAKRKAIMYLTAITSFLPVIIFIFSYFFVYRRNAYAIIAVILLLLFFSIPSWKKAAKVKKYYSNTIANEYLKSREIPLNTCNGTTDIPSDIIGKFVAKNLDKIFKKNK